MADGHNELFAVLMDMEDELVPRIEEVFEEIMYKEGA